VVPLSACSCGYITDSQIRFASACGTGELESALNS
jgi:hypothetical protein